MLRVREMDIEFCRHYANSLDNSGQPVWRYNEMKPCGYNYNSMILARVYDTYHRMFRDYKHEAEAIVATLDCDPSATVIDMGCGTGAFALHAAPHYRTVYAVDVSKAMLRRAAKQARKSGLKNIEFCHGGFLTYEHDADPVDAVSTVAALHHLPDVWKLVGLLRLASMLKPQGKLFLFDVVFSFDVTQHESNMKRFIQTMSVEIGPNGRSESETHLRDEFSTYDWIMESLLEKAGFEVQKADYRSPFLAGYLCTKKGQ
jgi:putative AdoMet-dependent methyltransferase